MMPHQLLLTLVLVVCVTETTYGCSCTGTFEQRVQNAEFAALVQVTSDEIPTDIGNYYKIDKKCELKTPYGTDVERVYMTQRKTLPGIRMSCDGSPLEKEKLYLIIGRLYDTNNPVVDSIYYAGCSGFVTQWHSQMNPSMRSKLRHLLPVEDCSSD